MSYWGTLSYDFSFPTSRLVYHIFDMNKQWVYKLNKAMYIYITDKKNLQDEVKLMLCSKCVTIIRTRWPQNELRSFLVNLKERLKKKHRETEARPCIFSQQIFLRHHNLPIIVLNKRYKGKWKSHRICSYNKIWFQWKRQNKQANNRINKLR